MKLISRRERHREKKKVTLKTSFPDSVGVPQARNNVIADLNRESQMIMGSFFQGKPYSFGVPILRNLKNNIRSTGAEYSKAQNLDIWFKSFYRETKKKIEEQ